MTETSSATPETGDATNTGTKPQYFTVEQVAEALRMSAGIKSTAAAKLNCAPSTITNYIERYPELNAVIAEAKQSVLDLSEGNVVKAISQGDVKTSQWYLETQGKHLGYTKQRELSGPGGGAIPVRDYTGYTDDDLEKLAEIHGQATRRTSA